MCVCVCVCVSVWPWLCFVYKFCIVRIPLIQTHTKCGIRNQKQDFFFSVPQNWICKLYSNLHNYLCKFFSLLNWDSIWIGLMLCDMSIMHVWCVYIVRFDSLVKWQRLGIVRGFLFLNKNLSSQKSPSMKIMNHSW